MILIKRLLQGLKNMFRSRPKLSVVVDNSKTKEPVSSRPDMPAPPIPIREDQPVILPPIETLEIKNHLLMSAKQIHDPASGSDLTPKVVVIHFTCSYNLPDTVEYFKRDVTDIHLLVDKDATTVQMVPFNRTADHAGKSSWNGYSSLNRYAIGIEAINIGPLIKKGNDYIDCYKRIHRGKVIRYPMLGYEYWEPFTDAQLNKIIDIVATLCIHYKIPVKNVCAHHEASPGRKVDVGGCIGMTMDQFRSLVTHQIQVKQS